MHRDDVLSEIAFDFGLMGAVGALERGLFPALEPQVPCQRLLPPVPPATPRADEPLLGVEVAQGVAAVDPPEQETWKREPGQS